MKRREDPIPPGYKRRGAREPKPPVRMSEAWSYHEQPPALVHTTGYSVTLYERGVAEDSMVFEHASTKLPAEDVTQLRELAARWLSKEVERRERDEKRDEGRRAA